MSENIADAIARVRGALDEKPDCETVCHEDTSQCISHLMTTADLRAILSYVQQQDTTIGVLCQRLVNVEQEAWERLVHAVESAFRGSTWHSTQSPALIAENGITQSVQNRVRAAINAACPNKGTP